MGMTYDHHRRVTRVANTNGPVDLASFTFDHDLASDPTSMDGTSDRVPASNVDYAYDALGRLTQADYGGSQTGSEVFEYDLLGNRERYVPRNRDAGQPDQGVQYEHNVVNEYTTITTDGAAAAVLYDAAGNLTRDERGYGYSYNFENRLTRIFNDANANGAYDGGEAVYADYAYDAKGRRTQTTIDGVTTRYYYDAQDVIAEYDAGNMSAPRRWYVHGTSGIDERAVMYTSDPNVGGGTTTDFYYLLGNVGSVVGLATDQGQVVESVQYDAYGKRTLYRRAGDKDADGDTDLTDFAGMPGCLSGPAGADGWTPPTPSCAAAYDADGDGDVDLADYMRIQAAYTGPVGSPNYNPGGPGAFVPVKFGALGNPYCFTGRRLDVVNGGGLEIQYNRARYYSPDHGRWYSRDPREYFDSQNLYEYAANTPTLLIDPNGESILETVLEPIESVAKWAAKKKIGFAYTQKYDKVLFKGSPAMNFFKKFIDEFEITVRGQIRFFTYKKCCVTVGGSAGVRLAFKKQIPFGRLHPIAMIIEAFLDLYIKFQVYGYVVLDGGYCLDEAGPADSGWHLKFEAGVDIKLYLSVETEAWIEWLGGKAYGDAGVGIKFAKKCTLPGGCGPWEWNKPYIFLRFGVEYKTPWGGKKKKEVAFTWSPWGDGGFED